MKFEGSKIINGFFLSCAVAGIAYLAFTKYYEKELKFCEDYPQLIKVNSDVNDYYYKNVDKESLQYDMIDGLIDGLDDRYSSYLSAKESKVDYVNSALILRTNGLRIDKDAKSNKMVVTDIAPDSVAKKKGIAVGDYIISIDDVIVQKNGFYNSLDLFLTKGKDSVELICNRGGEKYKVNLRKGEKPKVDSENTNKLFDNGTLYYKLTSFDVSTADNFDKVIKQYEDDVTSVIIDLRENTGGRTDSCLSFFDRFYGSGCQVTEIYEKTGEKDIYSTTDGVEYDFPVVLLVSDKTLSAAEMLMAFFQDTEKGVAIGSVTGGKGVFQRGTALDDSTMYKLVAGYYYVNDLPNYDGVGLTPDIIIDMDQSLIGTDDDIQLKKALEILG